MLYCAPWGFLPAAGVYPKKAGKTAGIWAYRYNGRFYRTNLPGYADIHNAGQYLANRIPRDDAKREEWIRQIITSIENELLWRTQRGIPTTETIHSELGYINQDTWTAFVDVAPDHPVDDRTQIAFEGIVPDYDLDWLCPSFMAIDWTYVIDLEDRAFTIDGILHFPLDRMPPDITRCLVRPLTCRNYYKMTPQAEMLCSTFVQRWPSFLKQPSEDCANAYALMSPIVTNLDEWGTRSWDDLNASEALSVHLVATILLDQSTQIRNPDIIGDRRMLAYCQWQLLTAAAPSALVLSPSPVPSDSHSSHPGIHIILDSGNRSDPRMSLEELTGKAEVGDWKTPPMWFRGCLIIICYRLDTPEFMMAEVHRMVQALKASHRSEGIGLIFDGRNVVGVALDNTHVRHSPVLAVYNHRLGLMDGFRLMMHLLSPCLLAEKTPWHSSIPQSARSPLPLPTEIIVRITQLVDYDTYDILPRVSYSFRQLYYTYPRFANTILLQPTTGGAFHAFDTDKQENFCAFFYRNPYSEFACRFYHRQRGLGLKFFTPTEYTKVRDECKQTTGRSSIEPQTLRCLGMSHIVRMQLQILDNTPDLNEPLIAEKVEVLMQALLGSWSLEEWKDHQEDGVWYRHHVVRDSLVSDQF